MTAAGCNSRSSETNRRMTFVSRSVKAATTGLVVAIAGWYAYGRGHASGPSTILVGFASWFGLVAGFLWMVGWRTIANRSMRPTAGESLGLGLAVFVLGVVLASWIAHQQELTLLWTMCWFPALVGMFFAACGILVATAVGRRRHVRYRLTDNLGLVLVVGFGVLCFIELRLHPLAL